MNFRFRTWLLPALLLTASAAPAHAGPDDDSIGPDRPGFAAGSGVVGTSRLQLETSVQWDRQRDDAIHERQVSTPTLLRFGLPWRPPVDGGFIDVDIASSMPRWCAA
jgi:hypothetical protein